jgi:phospholipid/cholesterol/gamma-HCH transport system substrate-binding protein
MSQRSTQIKVGLFVVFTILLMAVVVLQFSKGSTLFRKNYTIVLEASDVGGLRNKASVLLSGVQVGTVSAIQLSAEGTNVFIYLKIYNEYKLRDDATFRIEQSGFLGDPYVGVIAGPNKGNVLTNMSVAHLQEPFQLMEVARSAGDFVKDIKQTAKKLDDMISDVHRDLLNEQTLTNLSFTIATLKRASQDALVTVDNVNLLIKSNGPELYGTLSNLHASSATLTNVLEGARDGRGLISAVLGQGQADNLSNMTARLVLTSSNLQDASARLTNILNDVQQGRGLAGTLLKNQGVADNVSNLTANLAVTTSNLNRYGLWHLLFHKEKPAETNAPAKRTHSK